MAVYVDDLRDWGWVLRGHRVESCHLIADTLDELHEMAQNIGMKRSWFQDNGRSCPHYDLTESRRKAAVEAGAIELGLHDFVDKMREIRERLSL